MNGAYLHILLNHFPIMGLFFATVILLFAWPRRNETLARTALVMLVFTGVMTIATKLTGDPAEAVLSHEATFSRKLVHDHEHAANKAAYVTFATALLAALALGLAYRKKRTPEWCMPVLLLMSVVSLGFMVWTNKLGGKISHPEFRDESTQDKSGDNPKQNYEIDKD